MPRTKARNTIFTPAMDELLKEMYPTQGGKVTLRALNERFGKSYTMSQMHSRCRVLGLSALKTGFTHDEPAWPNGGHEKDFIGPPIYVAGCYFILEHIGYARPDELCKGQHRYKVRCRRCGRAFERSQPSIMGAMRKNTQGCYKCTHELKKLQQQQQKENEDNEPYPRPNNWWQWPAISIDLVPDDKLFDSQRMVRLKKRLNEAVERTQKTWAERWGLDT